MPSLRALVGAQAAADATEASASNGASDNGDANQNFSEDEGDWFADMQAQEEAEAARQIAAAEHVADEGGSYYKHLRHFSLHVHVACWCPSVRTPHYITLR